MAEPGPAATVAIPTYSAVAVDAAVDVVRSLARVLNRHRYVLGPEVERFETDFAAYCGVAACVAVANGTDALELGLRAVGVGPASRVAVVANAGGYGSTALHAIGAIPVYVDVDQDSLTMSAAALEGAAATGLDGVILTHLYGRIAPETEGIVEAARRLAIPVVEDCAQAHGGRIGQALAGSFGTLGCFSFYPTKNLPAIGDAGAVVTNDLEIARRIRELREYGWSPKYHVDMAYGRNSRMDEVQAAVLNDRLPMLGRWNAQRRAIAARYSDGLAGLSCAVPALGADFVAHLYVIRVPERERLRQSLSAVGIATDIHYPVPDHLQPAFRSHGTTSLPITEQASREVVTLPCFPGMSEDQVDRVIAAVTGVLS